MNGLKLTLGTLLGITSVWMIINGLSIAVQTMGRVSGSEFGMLITLCNLTANIILWLRLYGLWSLTPSTPSEEVTLADGTKQ